MKTKLISKTLLTLSLVFVLMSAITQVRGQGVVTIHSMGDVTRGQVGSFEVYLSPTPFQWGAAANFSVSGTAVPGVDYSPLVSPVLLHFVPPPPPCEHCTGWFRGVIPVKTLRDPRGSVFFPQAYSIVVTLEPGFGNVIGKPSSAQMMINP
jgi:hypothetical protein